MVLISISHFHHLISPFVDYIVNFVVELSMDHELMNVFRQLINNIELIIDLYPIYEQAEKRNTIQKISFEKKTLQYNILHYELIQ
jgi:thiamine biosynthesis protein ThiC